MLIVSPHPIRGTAMVFGRWWEFLFVCQVWHGKRLRRREYRFQGVSEPHDKGIPPIDSLEIVDIE